MVRKGTVLLKQFSKRMVDCHLQRFNRPKVFYNLERSVRHVHTVRCRAVNKYAIRTDIACTADMEEISLSSTVI
jgi:hypothetical protein